VIERTFALAPVALIRGNHDKVCAGLASPVDFNDIARQSVEWTAGQLTAAELEALAGLPQGPHRVMADLEICHGAPFDEDYYIFDTDDARRAIEAMSERVCLFGHTHLPAVYLTDNSQGPPAH